MADLPSVRVNQERVFCNVGIDYCGPFHIKGRRNQPPIKCYICIFVCMATKAAHLELVTDLTTEAFIAALNRFWAKRGYPQNIYCDNATNFVGADRELQRLQRQFEIQQHKSAVVDVSTRLGIQFHFIPPRSPSFGGLWEACVKSAKAVLLKVTMDLPYEEMLTTVAQERFAAPVSATKKEFAAPVPAAKEGFAASVPATKEGQRLRSLVHYPTSSNVSARFGPESPPARKRQPKQQPDS
ncbi:uncharacterized protein LOC120427368 [Culex pipiens pallens]|uniref:uncharacterized protein LOC120427368 n=1 Tax=Culex pipiens pallens TaxID=42434 RepID=UPI001954D4E8|nr:uncharacterized protein LOC120427368 [Culex pipiens pallens]